MFILRKPTGSSTTISTKQTEETIKAENVILAKN